MACIANVTRVCVPTSGPEVSSMMTRDHTVGSHHHADDICGGNTSVKSSLPSVVSSRPNVTATILKIPSMKDIAVDRAASSMKKNPGSICNSILSVSSKSSWKKRGRSELMMPSQDSSKNLTKASNSCTLSEGSSIGVSSNVSTTQEYIDKTEIELTKEQIDNVIDTTLPANFSFSLPLSLSPNNRRKMTTDSHEYDSSPKNKKPRQNSPPLTVVFTKMDRVQPGDDDDEATETPSQSSIGHARAPTSGRWTREEHEAFLEGLEIYGREWKKVAQRIPTRTSAQIRSHAQKYFAKLSKDEQSRTSLVNVQEDRNATVNPDRGEKVEDEEVKDNVVEYPPSVLDRMEKILRDPLGAEIEVAQTLKRLRERYNELHAKLQQQESNQDLIQKSRLPPGSATVQGHQGQFENSTKCGAFSPIYTSYPNPSSNPKFTFMEPSMKMKPEGRDDRTRNKQTSDSCAPLQSPAISNTPKQSRPCIRICNESLALHSRELIALSVLGGELYRSASYQDLSKAADSSLESPSRPLQLNDGSGGRFSSPTLDPVRPSLGDNKSSDTDSNE